MNSDSTSSESEHGLRVGAVLKAGESAGGQAWKGEGEGKEGDGRSEGVARSEGVGG